jgi:hypothetical protein
MDSNTHSGSRPDRLGRWRRRSTSCPRPTPQVLAAGTHDLPDHTTTDTEPVPTGGRPAPGPAAAAAGRRPSAAGRRPGWRRRPGRAAPPAAEPVAVTHHRGMVALDGLLEPEAGQTLLAALEPLARPTSADDDRSGGQRRADALAELARRNLESGRLPQSGGVRPQLTVTVDLDSLLSPGGLGGEVAPPGAWGCPDPAAGGRPDQPGRHRAVHEGGWRLTRGPDGRLTASPPYRRP